MDVLYQGLQELPKLGREAGGNGRQFTGGEAAEKGGKAGKRGGELVDLGQGFFLAGAEGAVAEACLCAGEGELLEGLQHLGGQAAATSTSCAALEFGAQFIALPRPLGCGGGVAAGLGDLGEGVVVYPGFLEAEGFVDLEGFVGVVLGSGEVAKE